MHIVTFSIIMIELAMLFFQVIYFLERKNDRNRLMYLILLLFLIAYNVCSGLFPDEQIPIPITIQIILAYLVGFTMSMYVVYYFYIVFDLTHLKFFATYGLVLFLFLPFLLLFVIPYTLTGNLELGRKLAVVIPFLYGLGFIYNTTRALIQKFAAFKNQNDPQDALYEHAMAAYISIVCWATLPVIVFFGDFQVLEHSVTNAGFLMMSIIYIRSSIRQARREYNMLLKSELALRKMVEDKERQIEHLNEQQKENLVTLVAKAYNAILNGGDPFFFSPAVSLPVEDCCRQFNLTNREGEILYRLIRGQAYKIIADELHISENTVSKHVSNIFAKVSVTNRIELINKIYAASKR